MRLRNFFFVWWAILASIGFASCGVPYSCSGGEAERITIMSWNTQLFFDPYENGSEYAEFTGAKTRWSAEKYGTRLDRLREILYLAGETGGKGPKGLPEIVVLQEIENRTVLEDLCNRIGGNNRFVSSIFVDPEKGTAFGTGILSRLPVIEVRAHTIDSGGVRVRPTVHCVFDCGGTRLHVFAVHWKSKGGSLESTAVRAAQEAQLAGLMASVIEAEPFALVVACGDFNQQTEEFTLLGEYASVWDSGLSQTFGPQGSYYYQGNWERIDNCFLSESLTDGDGWDFQEFTLLCEGPLLTEGAVPYRYEVFSGKGYSDHLPLLIGIKRM